MLFAYVNKAPKILSDNCCNSELWILVAYYMQRPVEEGSLTLRTFKKSAILPTLTQKKWSTQ
jgi:hypothetical protein